MKPTTPLRYPGGKGKLTEFVKLVFEENELLGGHYAEPYAGGAGVALNLLMLQYAACIHLNDIDPAVFAFWHSVLNFTEELCKSIRDAKLNVKERARQKAIQADMKNHSLLEIGFSTFYLNRTNRSGILNGGVIGGNDQTGEWKIDARFNKIELCRRVETIALYRSRIRLYNLDAADLIIDVLPSLPKSSLVYLDPPYYENADRLYRNHYKHDDHAAIANLVINKITLPWIVSYDNTPEICKMYRGISTIKYGMTYSAQEYYKGSEVMFFSPSLTVPNVKDPSKLKAA
jgi:DNA adenine methylase